MRYLLFNLQQVPEDEAEEVRNLLREHQIHFYETQAGRWRIGLAGIWLPDASQKQQAHALLDEYQKQRYQDARQERERLQEMGFFNAFVQNFYMEPLKVSAAILGVILVLSLSIIPFIKFDQE